jgi:hypothetical protein
MAFYLMFLQILESLSLFWPVIIRASSSTLADPQCCHLTVTALADQSLWPRSLQAQC